MFKIILTISCLVAIATADGVHKEYNEAIIKSSSNNVHPDGSYDFQFESDNGISRQEAGVGGEIVQGSATWIGRDGTPLSFAYIADQNGYRATGFHLPTSPPIPPLIQRSLDYLSKNAPKRPDEQL